MLFSDDHERKAGIASIPRHVLIIFMAHRKPNLLHSALDKERPILGINKTPARSQLIFCRAHPILVIDDNIFDRQSSNATRPNELRSRTRPHATPSDRYEKNADTSYFSERVQ
jgi:hypothetical protein